MCGIVGYIGNNATRISVEKLKLLQYRGYDSAGVGFVKNNEIRILKTVGCVQNLNADYDSFSAIAHTRWATHGAVCTRNAHPHKVGENWAIVHNGIIENYEQLKNGDCISDTDSEVVSALLEKHGCGLASVIDTAKKLEGSFAILALEKHGKIYALKNKSPLFVAVGINGIMFASDPVCFCGFSDTYYAFCDNECAVADENSLAFYDFYGQKIIKKTNVLTVVKENEDKGDFDSFMRKEIYDIPTSLQRINETYLGRYLSSITDTFTKAEEVWFIGCGTAYHACLFGEHIFAKAGIKCRAFIASEFRYADLFPSRSTLCVFVSQSGETADTLGALEKVSGRCTTVALTNVGYSTLAQKVELVIPTLAGLERAVASTKAYVCQVAIFTRIAHEINNGIGDFNNIEKRDVERIERIGKDLADKFSQDELFVLGRKFDYVTACECALKVKEVSYVNANAYPTGELKHGFIALLKKNSEVLVFATDPHLYTKSLSGALECKSRGAKVKIITLADGRFENVDEVIRVNSYMESIIVAQFFALHCAVNRKTNPDMPKNLAKSVTVE